jgi:hypothetical protein
MPLTRKVIPIVQTSTVQINKTQSSIRNFIKIVSYNAICSHDLTNICDSNKGLECLNNLGILCQDKEICKCECKDYINKYWDGQKCSLKLNFNQTCFNDNDCKFYNGLKCLFNNFYKSFRCQCISNSK